MESSIFPAEHIPESILVGIFSRLPVKSLLRFKCVNKSWCEIISSTYFSLMHLNNYPSTQVVVKFYGGNSISLLSPTMGNNLSIMDMELPSIGKSGGLSSLYRVHRSSCNGIVLIYSCPNKFALWNPATKDLKVLRPSKFYILKPLVYAEVGFGFDPKTNDYKILQHTVARDTRVIQFDLYSLRSDSWKKLKPISNVPSRYNEEGPISLSFTDKNILCWISMAKDSELRTIWEIVSFDLSDEKFEIIRLPKHLAILASKYYGMLFSFRDSMAIITSLWSQNLGPNNEFYDVWRREDCCTPESNNSWIKVLSIRAADIGYSAFLKGFFGNEQLIFHVDKESVVLYNIFTRETIRLGCQNLRRANSFEFKESLVSVSRFNN